MDEMEVLLDKLIKEPTKEELLAEKYAALSGKKVQVLERPKGKFLYKIGRQAVNEKRLKRMIARSKGRGT